MYTPERLLYEMKTTFSVLRETIEAFSPEANALRKVVNPTAGGNPIKTPFYAIYMAFYRLVVVEEQTPDNPGGIMQALTELSSKLTTSAKYTLTKDRVTNIDLTEGLIRKHFVKKEPPALRHGHGLALDFENSLRRSRIETPRYEIKQGIVRLSDKRELDTELLSRMIETICAIANIGPEADGYVLIGVADKRADAERIAKLDRIMYIEIAERYVVGIDREARLLGVTVEQYVSKLVDAIRNSHLSEPLRTQTLAKIDSVLYRNLSVVRITVPAQKAVSFVGDSAFVRGQSSTIEAKGRSLIAVSDLFSET